MGFMENSEQLFIHEQEHKCSTKAAGCRIKSGMTVGWFSSVMRDEFFEMLKSESSDFDQTLVGCAVRTGVMRLVEAMVRTAHPTEHQSKSG
ncbi:hypothetical protein ACO0LL_21795 [Undibacterium sp. TC4M20W]|uniref:hypothetical protein n=1 Tax=unclassified Undibacterium TaxID=2630295 RepID=UPI003BF455CB